MGMTHYNGHPFHASMTAYELIAFKLKCSVPTDTATGDVGGHSHLRARPSSADLLDSTHLGFYSELFYGALPYGRHETVFLIQSNFHPDS
jgi:hypothetical protein